MAHLTVLVQIRIFYVMADILEKVSLEQLQRPYIKLEFFLENVAPFLSTSARNFAIGATTYTDAIYNASSERKIKVKPRHIDLTPIVTNEH